MDLWSEKCYALELGLTSEASFLLLELGTVLEDGSKLGQILFSWVHVLHVMQP